MRPTVRGSCLKWVVGTHVACFLIALAWALDRLRPPNFAEGWFSDLAWNLNYQFNGRMAADIPWGTGWIQGPGKLYLLIHSLYYKVFGVGVYQGRFVSFLAGLALLGLLYAWVRRHATRELALLSVFLLFATTSFWFFSVQEVRQHVFYALVSFACFALLTRALDRGRLRYDFAAGFCAALSMDIDCRGVMLILIAYMFTALYSVDRRGLRVGCMVLGSAAYFLIWLCLNVLPMGLSFYLRRVIPVTLGDGGPYTWGTLASEFLRLNALLDSRIGVLDLALWCGLLPLSRLHPLRSALPARWAAGWLMITFVAMTLIERLDYIEHLLLYSPLLAYFCSLGLAVALERWRGLATGAILVIALADWGAFAAILYQRRDLDISGYQRRLRAFIDPQKAILGSPQHWYAFPDSRYYGGAYYLSRVIHPLKQLKEAQEYPDDNARRAALLGVLEARGIEYVIGCEALLPFLKRYFGENLPSENFLLLAEFQDPYMGQGVAHPPPFTTRIYQVVSYRP